MTHPNKTLCSIEAFRTYGIARSALLHALFSKKNIPNDMQEALQSYKLLVWNKELLAHKLYEIQEGTIRRFNKDYLVVWDWIDTRSSFLQASLDSEWFLSFREPQPEYGLPNVVYIRRKY